MSDRCPACDAMIIGNEQYCRQCAAPLLSSLPPTSPRLHWLVRTRAFVLLNCVFAVLPACMLILPLTAMVGGAMLVALGLTLACFGRRARYTYAVRLGLGQAGSAAIWALLVTVLNGVPNIQVLWAIMVLAALIFLLPVSLWVWQNHPARDLRLQCDRCGYWLVGQITARCPECGQSFDPARLIL